MTKKIDDFAKEDIDLGDKAFIETMAHIKTVVSEYIEKDEIKYEIFGAVNDAMKEFFENNRKELIEEIADMVSSACSGEFVFSFKENHVQE